MTAPIIHRDQALGFRYGDAPREYVIVNDAIYTNGKDVIDIDTSHDSQSDKISRRHLRYIAANRGSYYALYHLSFSLSRPWQQVTYLAREYTFDKVNSLIVI